MKRECGDCQLCCRLLPVKGMRKPALTRCQHQRHGKGCAVYHRPEKGFPWECGLWSCAWRENVDAAELRRPDRSHYVIDIVPDYISVDDGEGRKLTVPVVQVWADPKFPDCHRDPELRAWLLRRPGWGAIVRWSGEDATVLLPPTLMDTGQWLERTDNLKRETHSGADIVATLGAL